MFSFSMKTALTLLTLVSLATTQGVTAAISATCAAETEVVGAVPEVDAAADAITSTETSSNSGNTLTITYSDSSALEAACSAAGGKFAKVDLEVRCTVKGGGQSETLSVKTEDLAGCVGASCTDEELNEIENEVIDGLEGLGDVLDDDQITFTCGSTAFSRRSSFGVGVGAALAAVATWYLL